MDPSTFLQDPAVKDALTKIATQFLSNVLGTLITNRRIGKVSDAVQELQHTVAELQRLVLDLQKETAQLRSVDLLRRALIEQEVDREDVRWSTVDNLISQLGQSLAIARSHKVSDEEYYQLLALEDTLELPSMHPYLDAPLSFKDLKSSKRTQQIVEQRIAHLRSTAVLRMTSAQSTRFHSVFVSSERYSNLLSITSEQPSIVIIPVYSQLPSDHKVAVCEAIDDVADKLQLFRDAHLEERLYREGEVRLPPRLVVFTDVVHADLILDSKTIAVIHEYLQSCTVICLQATTSQSTDGTALDSWWWLRGGATNHWCPEVNKRETRTSSIPIAQVHAAIVQFLVFLLCDLISVQGFEGVSILRAALESGSPPASASAIDDLVEENLTTLQQVCGHDYGQLGLDEYAPLPYSNTRVRDFAREVRVALTNRDFGPRMGQFQIRGEWIFVPLKPQDIIAVTKTKDGHVRARWARFSTRTLEYNQDHAIEQFHETQGPYNELRVDDMKTFAKRVEAELS